MLKQLLEQGKQLTSNNFESSETKFLYKNFDELQQILTVLKANTPSAAKSNFFFASHGIDLDSVTKSIDEIQVETNATALVNDEPKDLEEFLEFSRERALTKLIDQVADESSKFYQNQMSNFIKNEWNQIRKDSIHNFKSTTLLPVQPNLKPLSIDDPKVSNYSKVIKELNQSRLNNSRIEPSQAFLETALKIGQEFKYQQIIDCWSLISNLCSMDLIEGSKKFFQDQFFKHVQRTVEQFPKEALIGGRPSKADLVKAYLSICFGRTIEKKNLELVQGVPIWALIFYLLRCGLTKEALNLANQFEIESFILLALKNFDQGISNSNLKQEFNFEFKNCIDPFKIALFKILGHCQVNLKKTVNQVIQTSEDYLWFQLNLLGIDYSFDEMVKMLTIKFGNEHFNPKNQNPIIYFQVLLICGQFESAINFLLQNSNSSFFTEAVHFSICFNFYKRLKIIQSASNSILVEDKLNFSLLLRLYSFNVLNSIELKFNYILLNSVEDQEFLKQEICDLISRSCNEKDFSILFGNILPDGERTFGLVDKYSSLVSSSDKSSSYTDEIISLVANTQERLGNFNQALKLYHIGKNYNKILDLLEIQLEQPFNLKESNLNEFKSIIQYFSSQPNIQSKLNESKFQLIKTLIKLGDFYLLSKKGNNESSLNCLIELDLIPLKGDILTISNYAEKYKQLPEKITSFTSELLLSLIQVLFELFKQAKSAFNSVACNQIKSQTRCLHCFVGLVQYKISQEACSKINQLAMEISSA